MIKGENKNSPFIFSDIYIKDMS